MTNYHVFLNGNRICPKCSAMMTMFHTHKDFVFKCMDCKSRFVIVGEENNDKEMILENVEVVR